MKDESKLIEENQKEEVILKSSVVPKDGFGLLSRDEYEEFLSLNRTKWKELSEEKRKRWKWLKQGTQESLVIKSPINWGVQMWIHLVKSKKSKVGRINFHANLECWGVNKITGRKFKKQRLSYLDLAAIIDVCHQAQELARQKGYCRVYRYGRYQLPMFGEDERLKTENGEWLPSFLEKDHIDNFLEEQNERTRREEQESSADSKADAETSKE